MIVDLLNGAHRSVPCRFSVVPQKRTNDREYGEGYEPLNYRVSIAERNAILSVELFEAAISQAENHQKRQDS